MFIVLGVLFLAGCPAEPSGELPAGEPGDSPMDGEDAATAPADLVIEVATSQELLAAIGPNRTIVLTADEYLLDHREGLPRSVQEYYSWVSVRDFDHGEENYELNIKNCPKLTIRAAGDQQVHIVSPYYGALVMSFSNCGGLRLSNLRIGHSPPSGYCGDGVMHITDCDDVLISNTTLYGCGMYGLALERVTDFVFDRSVIEQCTDGLMSAVDCSDLTFRDSHFRDTALLFGSGIGLQRTTGVVFENCLITNNHMSPDSSEDGPLFRIDVSTTEARVVINGGEIRGNVVGALVEPAGMVELNGTDVHNNSWQTD